MMDRKTLKLFALLCVELMVFFPVLSVYALTISTPEVYPSSGVVRIEWDTTSETNTSLKYGLYGSSSSSWLEKLDSNYKRNHSMSLSGLVQGETYSYQILSYAQDLNSDSHLGSFIVPDANPPPQPTGLRVTNYTSTTADIEWDAYNSSDVPDFSKFLVYKDGENIINTTSNKYTDTNLVALTGYVYNVAGYDSSGNTGSMSDSVMVLTAAPDITAPHLNNVKELSVTSTSAIIWWQTNEPADSTVYYGTGSFTMSRTITGTHSNHTVSLSGLTDNTRYIYIASSCDESGNCRNSSMYDFVAGGDNTAPSLSANVPSVSTASSMAVNGTTEALARVYIYVNDYTIPKRIVQADVNGDFSTTVSLDTSTNPNNVKIVAEDASGNQAEQEFSVTVDATLPVATASSFPTYTNSSSVNINGTVSEDVTLEIYVESEGDTSLGTPSAVAGVSATSVTSSAVALSWTANTNTEEIDYYKVYRNSVVVATTSGTSISDCVDNSTSYSYQVSAVNENCVEGAMSDVVSVTTETGANCTSTSDRISHSCDGSDPERTVTISQGSYKQSIPLEAGTNEVTLKFLDEVGNYVEIYGTTIYDVKAPTVTCSISDFSPTYDDEVTITGTVDEQATVTITVNNDSSYVGLTDSDGNFSIEIDLEQLDYDSEIASSASANQITGNVIGGATRSRGSGSEKITGRVVNESNYYSYQTGNSDLNTTTLTWTTSDGVFDNLIEIQAVDSVGRTSSKVSDYLEYKMCSYGNWWGITLSDPQPSMLIPRHLLRGIAQISFNYELEWLGGSGSFDSEETPSVTVDFSFRDIAREDLDDWDKGWFESSIREYGDSNYNNTRGYVIIQSKALNDQFYNTNTYRRDFNTAYQNNATSNFTTTLDMENNLSAHRTNSSWDEQCIVSQFGCVRLPVQVQLKFTDPVYASTSSSIAGTTTTSSSSGSVTQRQCIDMEIAIDVRIDTSIIPESFLESAIDFLNSTIDLIDSILEPLNDIKEYVLYACLGSWILLYVKSLEKNWACEMSGDIKSIFGGGFKSAVAEQGLCKAVYGENNGNNNHANDQKEQACLKCTVKVKAYDDFTETMQYICDRLACPSAPSFMKYIRDQNNKRSSTVKFSDTTTTGSGDSATVTNNFNLNLVSYSDCKGLSPTFEQVSEQYAMWKKYKENHGFSKEMKFHNPDSSTRFGYTASDEDLIGCDEPHMPNKDCCWFEYMRTYDSVCGLSYGVLFDEMKESYCVAGTHAQTTNNVAVNPESGDVLESTEGLTAGEDYETQVQQVGDVNYKQECESFGRRVWNAAAGFCEDGAAQQTQLIDSGIQYSSSVNQVYDPDTAQEQAREEAEQRRTTRETMISDQGNLDLFVGSEDGSGPSSVYDLDFQTNADNCPTTFRSNDNRNIFYRVTPSASSTPETPVYVIERGVVLQNIDIESSTLTSTVASSVIGQDSPVGSNNVFRPLTGETDIPESWFKQQDDEPLASNQDVTSTNTNSEGFENFKTDLLTCASRTSSSSGGTNYPCTLATSNLFVRSCSGSFRDTTDSITLTRDSGSDLVEMTHSPGGTFYGSSGSGSTCDFGGKDTMTCYFKPTASADTNHIITINLRKKISGEEVGGTALLNAGNDAGTYSGFSSSTISSAYTKIQSAIGATDKDEIVDPTSGFLRSVQCLCLPAITGYLKLWRAIMVAVKACFQTILLTGDGNPGVCRAVLTQYVCDLIYDLIQCFSTKYNAGFQRDYGTSNAGNLIGTLTSAGRDVERTISGRYGDSSLYRALFAERQLVHALCLWAFTGTFDFDFNTLIEGEYGDLPVASQGLLSPCQRRYISYNSNTGKATFNYYFGVGLVAGADLTYRVNLQCSDGWDCDYGNGNERCDCAGDAQNQSITLSGASSSMSRYDVLEEEYDGLITKDYRFDKVILEYTYRDKDNDQVKRQVSCDISGVGGTAPGFCQFDVGQGIYTCSVDIGSSSYAQLLSVDDPKSTSGWGVGDTVYINTMVMQNIPDTTTCYSAESCEHTLWLGIDLTDHNGVKKMDSTQSGYYRALLIDGSVTYGMGGYSIQAEDVGGSTFASYQCVADPTTSFVGTCSGSMPSQTSTIALAWAGGSANTVTTTTTGGDLYGSGGTSSDCSFGGAETTTCYFKYTSGTIITISLRKKDDSGLTISGGTVTLKASTTASSSTTSACSGTVKWNGQMVIYESEEGSSGFYTRGSSIYEYQGAEQTLPFSITVNCDDGSGSTGTSSNTFSAAVTALDMVISSSEFDMLSNPSLLVQKGNSVKFEMETNQDMNSAYMTITDASTSDVELSRRSMTKDGTHRKFTSSSNWVPADAGSYNVKFEVVGSSWQDSNTYTVLVQDTT